VQFPPGIAIMSAHVVYSSKRPIAIFGQEAGRLDMIGRRGFRIVETPCASSASVRVQPPLLGESHSPPVTEDRRWRGITLPEHDRAPPGLTRVAGVPNDRCATGPRHGTGPAEGAASPGKPISTRSRLRNGVSCDFSHYIGSRSMQGSRRPF